MIAPAHIRHGSNVTYSSQSSRCQLLKWSHAILIALISAWYRDECLLSFKLWALAIISPLCTITQPTGTSSISLALIASLQSTDGGAALTRQLKDAGEITEHESDIFAMFQLSADACITNFFSSGAVLFTLTAADGSLAVPTSMGVCLGLMLVLKVVGANIVRFLGVFRSKKKAA